MEGRGLQLQERGRERRRRKEGGEKERERERESQMQTSTLRSPLLNSWPQRTPEEEFKEGKAGLCPPYKVGDEKMKEQGIFPEKMRAFLFWEEETPWSLQLHRRQS